MKRQSGVAVVEFAFIVPVLLLLVLGLIELGRALYTWNTAVDATRRGARTAAIVAVGDTPAVLAEMRLTMPYLQDADVTVEYSIDGNFPGAACVRGTCRFVRVSVSHVYQPAVIFLPVMQLPPFSTTYPVEALGAT